MERTMNPAIKEIVRMDMLPWPENLIMEMGIKDIVGVGSYEPLTTDQIKGLQYIIGTLRENEQKAIRLRYEEHKSLGECAGLMGLTREGVRVNIKSGIKKLCHPSMSVFIKDGYLNASHQIEEKRRLVHKVLTQEERMQMLSTISIQESGMSVRTINCLRRCGFNTLDEVECLIRENMESFLQIRNIGRQSLLEIFEKLEEYGFDHSPERELYAKR